MAGQNKEGQQQKDEQQPRGKDRRPRPSFHLLVMTIELMLRQIFLNRFLFQANFPLLRQGSSERATADRIAKIALRGHRESRLLATLSLARILNPRDGSLQRGLGLELRFYRVEWRDNMHHNAITCRLRLPCHIIAKIYR